MTHHHHHHPGDAHPSPPLSPSLLRLSIAQRLAVVSVMCVFVWAIVAWAIA